MWRRSPFTCDGCKLSNRKKEKENRLVNRKGKEKNEVGKEFGRPFKQIGNRNGSKDEWNGRCVNEPLSWAWIEWMKNHNTNPSLRVAYIDVDVNFMVAAVQIEHINTVTDSFPCLIAVVSIDWEWIINVRHNTFTRVALFKKTNSEERYFMHVCKRVAIEEENSNDSSDSDSD